MHEYDKFSKYMIQHHGDSILRMAGVYDIATWIARQAELVQTRQLPDGLLEVRSLAYPEPDIFILEIATDPDARVPSQAVRDTASYYLLRNILPEVIVVFLREKGHLEAADSVTLHSRRGLTKLDLSWKVVKLWEIPAEELLGMGDVGLIPWVPLAQFADPPERIVSRCRAHIDHHAPSLRPLEHQDLLATTQMMVSLRYNEKEDRPLLERLRALLGGREVMIQSPLYQEIVEESERKGATEGKRGMLLDFLVDRFGPAAQSLEVELKAVELDRLRDLLKLAAKCRTLAAFRKRLWS